MALLEIEDLHTSLVTRWGVVRAVDGVTLSLDAGETLGVVGESGSGKSMLCLSILRLLPEPAGRIVRGRIVLDGEDLVAKTEREMERVRGRKVSMILQDPMSSLNPVFSIGMQLQEAIAVNHPVRGRALIERAERLLEAVGISSPATRLRSFPHQLSGGMRQRVVGAMAISAPPRLLIADEPTTSLDLTIQAQYLRLLEALPKKHRLAMIFVTHNLGIVAKLCGRVAVMYAGRIVEAAPVRRLFDAPAHPYSRALLGSIPKMGTARQRLTAIDGQPPDLTAPRSGCAFAPRCGEALPRCRVQEPGETTVGANHVVRCWLHASA
jgi:oligopeptide/dipeptide ABC transporter ATP-binding protein